MDQAVLDSIELNRKINEEIDMTALNKLQDPKTGNWYTRTPEEKKLFKTHAENYILTHTQQADPRKGLGRVFMYDEKKGDFDEKLIRNYQKFVTGEKEGIMFNSKQKDLIKKLNRNFRESPDIKALETYFKKTKKDPDLLEQYLNQRSKEVIAKKLDTAKLSRESIKIGGEPIEFGHVEGLMTNIDKVLQGETGRPATSIRTVEAEPSSANRGKGRVGGSDKSINLHAAAGTVPRHWVEDYVQWEDAEIAKKTGGVSPQSEWHKEFNLQEQEKLRNIPENASAKRVDNVKQKIYEDREKLQKQHGIELHSKTGKKLDAEGLFRNIAKAAGQSNNPLANVSGDIVGAVMDGVAFAANPKDKDALADLALSGSQALLSLGAIGLAAVPIPGARPGAFMLMKLGDNIGKVEKLWNLSGKITATSKLGKTKNLIQADWNRKALLGKLGQ